MARSDKLVDIVVDHGQHKLTGPAAVRAEARLTEHVRQIQSTAKASRTVSACNASSPGTTHTSSPASRSTALMSPSAFTRVVLDQAHQRLQAPVVQIWDNLNTHVSHRMHALIAARPWLTVIWLPAYAPDLNPTECVWRWMKRGLTVETARTLAFQPL